MYNPNINHHIKFLSIKAKYGNKKTSCNGKTFDSKKEADRYLFLLSQQKLGKITHLQTQVHFELIPKQLKANGNAERKCEYVADFVYIECDTGREIVEDVKGFRTPEYVIKRKLMLYMHNIEITEI